MGSRWTFAVIVNGLRTFVHRAAGTTARVSRLSFLADRGTVQIHDWNITRPERAAPEEVHHDCAGALAAGFDQSGVYTADFGTGRSFPVYCDMESSGGGWTLLLTQTEVGIKDTSPGSVVPFRQSVNADAPSTTAMYARDWSDTLEHGVGLLPAAGDEFMIRRVSDGDVVTLELDQWCAGPDWLNVDPSVGAPCGGNGHPRYGTGQLEFPGGGVQGSYSFYAMLEIAV